KRPQVRVGSRYASQAWKWSDGQIHLVDLRPRSVAHSRTTARTWVNIAGFISRLASGVILRSRREMQLNAERKIAATMRVVLHLGALAFMTSSETEATHGARGGGRGVPRLSEERAMVHSFGEYRDSGPTRDR